MLTENFNKQERHQEKSVLFHWEGASSMFHLTLPLSGRQGAWGGAAERRRSPVHSRGLLGEIM
jgi:hypothetical protein